MAGSTQTKNLLAKSLQELMQSQPLEKISINDIVERAGVGRNTFYYHFADKYDLVNWTFQSGIMQFLARRATPDNWQAIAVGLEEYFRENKTFYTNALSYTGQNNLRDYIQEFLAATVTQRLRDVQAAGGIEPLSDKELRFAGRFLSGAVMGILIPWVRDGMKGSITDYASCLHMLCTRPMAETVFGLCDSCPPPAQT
ncbi:MAG TPA: TetR/AcrR family transcriptional regulator [Candidatus Gemmiger faecigallinarum]|nr:TetR/AcrR family transcriptional regulator [Candidatus Gemmiger faecigallinarum]